LMMERLSTRPHLLNVPPLLNSIKLRNDLWGMFQIQTIAKLLSFSSWYQTTRSSHTIVCRLGLGAVLKNIATHQARFLYPFHIKL
jgi:hypothetical protein